jgi:hypothetical protein
MTAAEVDACGMLFEHGVVPPDAELNRETLADLTGLTSRRLGSDVALSASEKAKVVRVFELNGSAR